MLGRPSGKICFTLKSEIKSYWQAQNVDVKDNIIKYLKLLAIIRLRLQTFKSWSQALYINVTFVQSLRGT